jgi:hypothetical protein
VNISAIPRALLRIVFAKLSVVDGPFKEVVVNSVRADGRGNLAVALNLSSAQGEDRL